MSCSLEVGFGQTTTTTTQPQHQKRNCTTLSPETREAALKILEKYYSKKYLQQQFLGAGNGSGAGETFNGDVDLIVSRTEVGWVGPNPDLFSNQKSNLETLPYCNVESISPNEKDFSSLTTPTNSHTVLSVRGKGSQQRLWNSVNNSKIGHVTVLLIALICYIIFGSWTFQRLEGFHAIEHLKKFAQLSHARHTRYYHLFRNLLHNEHCSHGQLKVFPMLSTNISRENLLKCNNVIRKLLLQYDEEIFLLADLPFGVIKNGGILNNGLDDEEKAMFIKSDWQWNYWNSAFFALSVITTIGYGNMSCETTAGRMATIIYAVIGIPLMLVVLSNLGEVIFDAIQAIYNWSQRKLWEMKNRRNHKPVNINNNSVEQNQPTTTKITTTASAHFQAKNFQQCSRKRFYESGNRFTTIPLYLAMMVVFLYISFCAFLIWFFEKDWDWFTAFYFLFVSLSTIGLGDEMPQYSHCYSVYSFIFLIIGLSLVSMCISVMKIRVENQYLAALELLDESNQRRRYNPPSANCSNC